MVMRETDVVRPSRHETADRILVVRKYSIPVALAVATGS